MSNPYDSMAAVGIPTPPSNSALIINTPFLSAAPALRANGYSVIPLEPSSKRVIIKNWTSHCNEPADDNTFTNWLKWPDANIGVCLGLASNLIALDYDYDVDNLHQKIQEIVPDSPVKKMGAKGFTAFYRYSGEKSASFKIAGETVIEVLSSGRQTVLPPSIHPDGMTYQWLTPTTLENTGAATLPFLTSEHLSKISALFAKPETKNEAAPTLNTIFHPTGDAQIRAALAFVPADDYDTWITVGMALKSHFGDAGYSLFDVWSSKSSKYGGSDDTRQKWGSFDGSGITIATLYHKAAECGYKHTKPSKHQTNAKSNVTNVKAQVSTDNSIAADVAAGKDDVTEPPNDSADVVSRLAALPLLDYEKMREAEAARLGVRVSALDKEVETARKGSQVANGKISMFPLVELWPQPVDGVSLLNELVSTIHRFIICSKETARAVALWCVFTWFIDHVLIAPLAVINAPEKRCGKSLLLILMGKFVCRPLVASNISPSATFRVIEAHHPTLLIDEADTFFKDNEELRGVINSGHTRQSAYVIRNVGDNHEPTQFSTWGAKAISGIGALSETLMDRAVVLTLRRKLPGEKVERLRHAEAGLFEELASKLARFSKDNGAKIALSRPPLPDALNDRAQDNWEPLLAIADCAGGEWPKLARDAAKVISGAEQESVSLSAELLADIREVFIAENADRLSSAELIKSLCDDDEKSWATYNRGQPIRPRQLAKWLSEYGIASKGVRFGLMTLRGFERAQFEDAFTRYLPPPASATVQQTTARANYSVADKNPLQNQVQHVADCCETENGSKTVKPAPTLDCGVVADFIPPTADNNMVEVTL